jgi:hypothetical protein
MGKYREDLARFIRETDRVAGDGKQ